jgi:hypothetical protein
MAFCWLSGEAPMRTILLLMLLSGALCGCAHPPVPSPQSLDARALCQQQAQASASVPEQKDAYFDQCMIANGQRSQSR